MSTLLDLSEMYALSKKFFRNLECPSSGSMRKNGVVVVARQSVVNLELCMGHEHVSYIADLAPPRRDAPSEMASDDEVRIRNGGGKKRKANVILGWSGGHGAEAKMNHSRSMGDSLEVHDPSGGSKQLRPLRMMVDSYLANQQCSYRAKISVSRHFCFVRYHYAAIIKAVNSSPIQSYWELFQERIPNFNSSSRPVP